MSNENAIPNSHCSLLQVCYVITDCKNFLFKKLEDISPFCGATDTPVLDFWWNLLWVSKPEEAALFTLGRGIWITYYLRFISGATPANLLAASKQPSHSLPCTCEQALVGLESGIYCATTTSLCETRQTLYRLSYAGSVSLLVLLSKHPSGLQQRSDHLKWARNLHKFNFINCTRQAAVSSGRHSLSQLFACLLALNSCYPTKISDSNLSSLSIFFLLSQAKHLYFWVFEKSHSYAACLSCSSF